MSEESQILTSLRQHGKRLRDETSYVELNPAQIRASAAQCRLGDELDFFESGLRNIMRRDDLDEYLSDALSEAVGQSHLKSLCVMMNSIVNPRLLTRDFEEVGRYPKLNALLGQLRNNTHWNFTMVSEPEQRLFQVNLKTFKEDKITVDRFNDYFDILKQPRLEDVRFLIEDQRADESKVYEEQVDSDPLLTTLLGLRQLFASLKPPKTLPALATTTNPSCQGCHQILLRLPKWNRSVGDCSHNRRLRLFLSSCRYVERCWLESELVHFMSM